MPSLGFSGLKTLNSNPGIFTNLIFIEALGVVGSRINLMSSTTFPFLESNSRISF